MPASSARSSQLNIYHRLRTLGSSWSKSHVLYGDHKIIVLNKPPGLVCQLNNSSYKLKSERNHTFLNTVFNDIHRWFPPPAELHSVHRLDKTTTGCLILSASHPSAKALTTQFRQGTVKKTYLALVRGGDKSFPTNTGVINDPILYSDGRAETHPEGKVAQTGWKLLSSSPKAPVFLLELDLTTGNKHQLRIHLSKVLQTPILGDTLYCRKPTNHAVLSSTAIPDDRIFLHSAEVSFFKYHSTGKRYRLSITAPPPEDFRRICDDLDISIPASFSKANLSVDTSNGHSAPQLWNPLSKYP